MHVRSGTAALAASAVLAAAQWTAGAAIAQPPEAEPEPVELGDGRFRSPETVVWDEERDLYLLSNVNGGLTALDDNGFISRITPDGEITQLKWIDGSKPDVTLHGPKGMLLTAEHLIVADVHTLRFFDRDSGEPVREVAIRTAYMLNDPARAPDGTLFVSDTGGSTTAHPGAVYRVDDDGPVRIASGPDYDRPDGLLADERGLLVAPFEAHAKEMYRLVPDGGRREPFATAPQPRLDGLLELPDGSHIVTSWAGKSVYRLRGDRFEPVLENVVSPAQVGYDEKRGRLLVPLLKEDKLLALDLPLH